MSQSVPGFLSKTYDIFNSSEYSDCCGWGVNGDTIVIKKVVLKVTNDNHWSLILIEYRLNNFQKLCCQNSLNMRIFNHLYDN